MDFKLELVIIPVTDVDRAKAFYSEKLGFNVDVDFHPNDNFRVVQLTPPGSACSITIGKGLSKSPPGSYDGTHLVVNDIIKARELLLERGVEVGEVKHMGPDGWTPGPHPERADYGSFADLKDPDGNSWVLQEVKYAKPGT